MPSKPHQANNLINEAPTGRHGGHPYQDIVPTGRPALLNILGIGSR